MEMTAQEVEQFAKPGVHVASTRVGLRLCVREGGKKSWRMQARHNGIPYTRSIGNYPEISFEQATATAEKMRLSIEAGDIPKANNDEGKEKTKYAAKSMYLAGVASNKIAAELGITYSTLARWTKDFKKESGPVDAKVPADAPWAKVLRDNNEAAGHAIAARILSLAEPQIMRAIRDAAWQAIDEILGTHA